MIIRVNTATATDEEIRRAIEDLERVLAGRFEPNPPASREAVETIRVGSVCYQLELVKCGKVCRCMTGPGHGPYWYSYWRVVKDGKPGTKSGYIGKKAPAEVLTWLAEHGRSLEDVYR